MAKQQDPYWKEEPRNTIQCYSTIQLTNDETNLYLQNILKQRDPEWIESVLQATMYAHVINTPSCTSICTTLEANFLKLEIFETWARNHFHSVTYTSLMQTTRGFIILHSRSSIVRLQERNTSLKNRNRWEHCINNSTIDPPPPIWQTFQNPNTSSTAE